MPEGTPIELTKPYAAPNDRDALDLETRFTYHSPDRGQALRYELLRSLAGEFAVNVVNNCPPSRERSLALTKIEEAVMWANAAIARRESNDV